MSVKANPARIGAFVVGAVVLLVACLVVFGSGRFFERTDNFVSFFEGSVAGLNVGAPVTWQGVPFGSVTDIQLQFEPATLTARIPVFFKVSLDKVQMIGTTDEPLEQRIQRLINEGLRAQLVSQSLVTGQLAIQLSFEPGTPVNLVSGDFDAIEIPTVPSTVQKLMSELQKLKLDQLAHAAHKLLVDLDALVGTPDAKALVPDLRALINDGRTFLFDLNAEMIPTMASLRGATDSAKAAFDQGKTTVANLDTELSPAVADMRRLVRDLDERVPQTLARLDAALVSVQSALNSVDRVIQPDSATMRDLRRALVEFAGASRSVRELADELDRNPSMLIRGK